MQQPSIEHLLVSVVIPVLNEEAAIGDVVDEVRATMDSSGCRYEVLVVDDGSTDGTAQVAESRRAWVVRRPTNGGTGTCRKTGILAAHGDIVVMLDGDGSYAATDIPALLAHMPAYDQVNGFRTREQGNLKWLRTPAKWLVRRLACFLTRSDIPDLNTGLKAFRRDVMLDYLWVLPRGFSCVTSMTLAFLCNGYTVKYVPVSYRKRVGRSKFRPVRDTWNYLATVLRMVMLFAPLRVLGPLAVGLLLASALTGGYHFFIHSGHTLQEMDIICFVAGATVMTVGMLGELAVRRRPTSDREVRYWRRIYDEDDSAP
jgi:glycosyltransferase involved in cell wall biosynthesis